MVPVHVENIIDYLFPAPGSTGNSGRLEKGILTLHRDRLIVDGERRNDPVTVSLAGAAMSISSSVLAPRNIFHAQIHVQYATLSSMHVYRPTKKEVCYKWG